MSRDRTANMTMAELDAFIAERRKDMPADDAPKPAIRNGLKAKFMKAIGTERITAKEIAKRTGLSSTIIHRQLAGCMLRKKPWLGRDTNDDGKAIYFLIENPD